MIFEMSLSISMVTRRQSMSAIQLGFDQCTYLHKCSWTQGMIALDNFPGFGLGQIGVTSIKPTVRRLANVTVVLCDLRFLSLARTQAVQVPEAEALRKHCQLQCKVLPGISTLLKTKLKLVSPFVNKTSTSQNRWADREMSQQLKHLPRMQA